MICQKRNRTEQKDIAYALHLYFNGLSLRNTSKALSRFIKRSHSAIRDYWILKYKPDRLFFRKIKISEFIIDETQIKIGSELIWIWVGIEAETKNILLLSTYQRKEKYVCSTERVLDGVTKEYGKHPVSTDWGTWYPPPQAC